jgi:pimeloyl-ACP methyl ester carboxylesterase
VVHGSGRNADDYLACAVASTSTHEQDSTPVLAPRFLAPGDGLVNATNLSVKLLCWAETFPIPHMWRYGADVIRTGISSYQAMDALVEQLSRTAFPLLEDIVVAGHSAGGQFTQRWALTSGSAAWGDKHDSPSSHVCLRVVAANPCSFCYLDGHRNLNGTFQLPIDATIICFDGETLKCTGR